MQRSKSKQPLRSCIGCRTVRQKKELIRLVRSFDGKAEWDFSRCGKMPGRGTYICANVRCWQEALKRKAVNRSLRIELSEEDKVKLTFQLERSGIV